MLLYKHTKQLRLNKSNKIKRNKMTKKQTETKIVKKTPAKKDAASTAKVSKKDNEIKKANLILMSTSKYDAALISALLPR